MKNMKWLIFCVVAATSSCAIAKNNSFSDPISACINDAVRSADPSITLEELIQSCNDKPLNVLEQRQVYERNAKANPFAILPYKPNYVLPASYSSGSTAPYDDFIDKQEFDELEVKFQVSMKYIVFHDMIVDDLNLEAGFTVASWWQAYNKDSSSPFRETNYEPEIMLHYTQPWSLAGVTVSATTLSLNHQSNGKPGSLSRSWNRIIAGLFFIDDDFIWGVRAWWRLPEDLKENPTDSIGDDNPDIEKYMGYGDLNAIWKLPNEHNIELKLRNNFRADNKGAVELGWSFPIRHDLHLYVQYFNGYGESLIYYEHSISRISVGFKLTEWL